MAGGILMETDLSELKAEAFDIRQTHFPNAINFYAPGIKHFSTEEFQQKTPRAFRPVSLTGSACALQCEHCKSKILEPMIALNQQEGLFNTCKRLSEHGTNGVLISGGSQKSGQVPLRKYADDIARVKNELGMRVMVHCGVIDEETAALMKSAGVDGMMLDIIGADETIRDVYHLDLTVEDFDRSMEYLIKYDHSVRPHIILGLHFGQFLGEHTALAMLEKYPIHSLILVILTPMVGTPMQDIAPPAIPDIEQFFYDARVRMPQTPVLLGCARPLGDHKLAVDHAAVDFGLNGIAYPAEGIIQHAKSKGLRPCFHEDSCSCGG